MIRWQYLRVRAEHYPNGKGKFWIRRPGEQEEVLPDDTDFFALANELGADRWELVIERIGSSAVVTALGWNHASTPVRLTWTFKRSETSAPTSEPPMERDEE